MRRHLSMAPSEYSYFRADSLEIWAGPSHWKIKPYKGAVLQYVRFFFFPPFFVFMCVCVGGGGGVVNRY